MRAIRLICLIAMALCAATVAAPAQETAHACDAAAARAEKDWNVPTGVLSAVGTVESGRRQGSFGAAPWPWTINAAGRGFYFESKPAAIDAVLALMQRGYPYIDVGCFQIDIAYHPDQFRSLDDAFDPERNAQAAARILTTERLRAPDWATAIAHYHSATPELGAPYLQRVRAALPQAKLRGLNAEFLLGWSASETLSPYVVIPGSGGTRDASLPRVIYPGPPPSHGGMPQILVLGAKERLPTVIITEIPPPSTRR